MTAAGVARAVTRASPEPVLVRLAGFGAALVALLVAAPAGLPAPALVALVGLAALPAVWPRGPWVTVVALAAVAGWLADTGLLGTEGVPAPGRLLLLATALYLLHTLAALAATLPYDAVVAPDVLLRWLLRTGGVVLASALLSGAVLAGLGWLAGGQVYLVATLAGLAVAAALTRVLAGRAWARMDP